VHPNGGALSSFGAEPLGASGSIFWALFARENREIQAKVRLHFNLIGNSSKVRANFERNFEFREVQIWKFFQLFSNFSSVQIFGKFLEKFWQIFGTSFLSEISEKKFAVKFAAKLAQIPATQTGNGRFARFRPEGLETGRVFRRFGRTSACLAS